MDHWYKFLPLGWSWYLSKQQLWKENTQFGLKFMLTAYYLGSLLSIGFYKKTIIQGVMLYSNYHDPSWDLEWRFL